MGVVSRMQRVPITTIGFYIVSVWCTTELFQHHAYDWSFTSGASMYPTLPSYGTKIIVNHSHRYGRKCKVGDIVKFKSPIFLNEMAAKRILGMPGDYVVLDENQSAGVGGAKGPWMNKEEIKSERLEPKMVQVPEGHVWVVGDNMAYSRDSRFFGPLPMALIVGKVDCHVQNWLSWTSFRENNLAAVPMEEVD